MTLIILQRMDMKLTNFVFCKKAKGYFFSQLDTVMAQLTVDPKFKHCGILGPHYT